MSSCRNTKDMCGGVDAITIAVDMIEGKTRIHDNAQTLRSCPLVIYGWFMHPGIISWLVKFILSSVRGVSPDGEGTSEGLSKGKRRSHTKVKTQEQSMRRKKSGSESSQKAQIRLSASEKTKLSFRVVHRL